MTCKELVDFLDDYLEDALPEGQRCVFEHHLGDCPPCLDYLESYRRTVQAARAALDPDAVEPVPACEVPPQLIQAILRARRGGSE
jgi:anti-sigma factor RsiW